MRVLTLFFILLSLNTFGQVFLPYGSNPQEELPEWAELMYSQEPNAWEVRDAYEAYYRTHPFEKTIHTQNYKRWIRAIQSQVGAEGSVRAPGTEESLRQAEELLQSRQADIRGGGWYFAGPEIHYNADGTLTPTSEQANVYCHDRSFSDPDILYCGTESGGVYKTTDQGQNWEYLTLNYPVTTITAIRVHPENPDVVIFAASGDLWRSTDGGMSWTVIGDINFQNLNLNTWEIAFQPDNPEVVFAATNQGLFRSENGGDTWTEVLAQECMTIAFQPGNPEVVYTIQYEPQLNYSRFYKSTNGGLSFTLYETGWYSPSPGDEGLIAIEGGRLAVTEADPDRIYALLVGYQEQGAATTTNGWVGAWVSYDGGETWQFPHGSIGTPYTAEHPNLMNFSGDDGSYTQIHYNTTIAASHIDPDKVLIGGLNLWQSDDACATYYAKAGYIGYVPNVHVDMQEIRIYKTGNDTEEVWLSNDGGIHYSTEFMESHESRCRGIKAGNLWGYDQGWNHDIMAGGRYHNGNMGFYETYGQGEFLALGGGEAPTGYVNYSDERKVFHSDIGGRILPEEIDETPQFVSMALSPNESYWFNNSSRLMFDNRYYNVAWMGRENRLYRSNNGGSIYGLHHQFGNNPDHWVLWMEQSYADPNVFVLHQATGNSSKLWISADGGDSWNEISMPYYFRNLVFTLGSNSPGEIWVAYTYGSNGNKVFKTNNGGLDWENITTSALNGKEIWAIAHQYGTDGGVYLGCKPGEVFYRNNGMNNWDNYSSGLPVSAEPLRIVPFYREGKVRFASWNLAVWERDLYEPSSLMADFAAEFATFFCPGEPVHFVDHSVCSAEATYEWSFPGATPETSTSKYPTVVYAEPGNYSVTLTVTDQGFSDTVTKEAYISSADVAQSPLIEGFEGAIVPDSWKFNHVNGGNFNWYVTDLAGGYGESTYSLFFDNYWQDVGNSEDEVWTPRIEPGSEGELFLHFDVAYAPYGFPYTDTLAVLVSDNCGISWDMIYQKGNTDLATAAPTGDPFIPAANEWRTEEIDLSNYLGAEEIIIAFRNMGSWGNYIYVDNINLATEGNSIETVSAQNWQLFPNPASDRLFLKCPGSDGPTEVEILDVSGKRVMSLTFNNPGELIQLPATQLTSGLYLARIQQGGKSTQLPFVVNR